MLHTDSVLLYYQLYGEFPKYLDTKENRKKFVAIFTDLFNTGHQQACAEQNASGIFALKIFLAFKNIRTLLDTYPADILKRVFPTKESLESNEFLSRLNKPKNVFKKGRLSRILSHFSKKQVQKTKGQKQLCLLAQTPSDAIGKVTPLSVDSSQLFAETVSTVAKQSPKPTPDESPIPTDWVTPRLKTKEVRAVYFPQGSNEKYQTNTLEIIGKTEAQMSILPLCAMKYFVKNPEGSFDLNGSPRILEGLQWIFIAGLNIPQERIRLPSSIQAIQITRDRKGAVRVPAQYKQLVSETRKLKREYDLNPRLLSAMEQPSKTAVQPRPAA